MKIYVASSWRNAQQQHVVQVLRAAGHEVFDFKNPPGGEGFTSWPGRDATQTSWTKEEALAALEHPRSKEALKSDWDGMRWADAVVCVQPFGKSASVELGWAVGAGKPTALLLADGEPELMQSMADVMFTRLDEVVEWLGGLGLRCSLTTVLRECLSASEEHAAAREVFNQAKAVSAKAWDDGSPDVIDQYHAIAQEKYEVVRAAKKRLDAAKAALGGR